MIIKEKLIFSEIVETESRIHHCGGVKIYHFLFYMVSGRHQKNKIMYKGNEIQKIRSLRRTENTIMVID